MANVKFTDNSVSVKSAIKEACIQGLQEAGMLVRRQVIDISRTDTGATKGSFDYSIDEGDMTCQVGSPMENAIWEEFGTGVYAENGNGRKSPWVYTDRHGKTHKTRGKTGTKALRRSFDMKKAEIVSRFEDLLRGLK